MAHLILRVGFNVSIKPAIMIQMKDGWFGMIFPKRERIEKWFK